jgi:hypothetical protein
VKSTFEFNIRSPLPVLASGLPTGVSAYRAGSDGERGTLLYSFKQDVPIPSYLFALASGDLASASIGPRSTVWTGPEELQKAKWELERDTERFIQVAERLLFPYAWTTYNVLVLPASFPYGGPCCVQLYGLVASKLTQNMANFWYEKKAWKTPSTHMRLRPSLVGTGRMSTSSLTS